MVLSNLGVLAAEARGVTPGVVLSEGVALASVRLYSLVSSVSCHAATRQPSAAAGCCLPMRCSTSLKGQPSGAQMLDGSRSDWEGLGSGSAVADKAAHVLSVGACRPTCLQSAWWTAPSSQQIKQVVEVHSAVPGTRSGEVREQERPCLGAQGSGWPGGRARMLSLSGSAYAQPPLAAAQVCAVGLVIVPCRRQVLKGRRLLADVSLGQQERLARGAEMLAGARDQA